jgi:alpha-L-rhamnosidase
MKILCCLFLYYFVFIVDSSAQVKEPYQPVHGGSRSGPLVKESPDPLITYRWDNPKASDSLEIYMLQPKTMTGFPNSSCNQNKNDITVSGEGSLMFDFAQENAALYEFESDDLAGNVEAGISEYNEPAIVNTGAQHRRGETEIFDLKALNNPIGFD